MGKAKEKKVTLSLHDDLDAVREEGDHNKAGDRSEEGGLLEEKGEEETDGSRKGSEAGGRDEDCPGDESPMGEAEGDSPAERKHGGQDEKGVAASGAIKKEGSAAAKPKKQWGFKGWLGLGKGKKQANKNKNKETPGEEEGSSRKGDADADAGKEAEEEQEGGGGVDDDGGSERLHGEGAGADDKSSSEAEGQVDGGDDDDDDNDNDNDNYHDDDGHGNAAAQAGRETGDAQNDEELGGDKDGVREENEPLPHEEVVEYLQSFLSEVFSVEGIDEAKKEFSDGGRPKPWSSFLDMEVDMEDGKFSAKESGRRDIAQGGAGEDPLGSIVVEGVDVSVLKKYRRIGEGESDAPASRPQSGLSALEEAWFKKESGIGKMDAEIHVPANCHIPGEHGGDDEAGPAAATKLSYLPLDAALVATALYGYEAADADSGEISFSSGEKLLVLGEALDDDGWYVCRNKKGAVGLAPETHFAVEKKIPPDGFRTSIATRDFVGDGDRQVRFKKGDVIRVQEDRGKSDEWMALRPNGSVCHVPKSHVEVIEC